MITYYIFIKWLFYLENNQEWEYSSPWELMHFSLWVSCLLKSYFQVPLYWKINFSLILFQSSIITHWYIIILLKSAFLKSRRCMWVQRSPAQVEGTQGFLTQPEKDLENPPSRVLNPDSPTMTREQWYKLLWKKKCGSFLFFLFCFLSKQTNQNLTYSSVIMLPRI